MTKATEVSSGVSGTWLNNMFVKYRMGPLEWVSERVLRFNFSFEKISAILDTWNTHDEDHRITTHVDVQLKMTQPGECQGSVHCHNRRIHKSKINKSDKLKIPITNNCKRFSCGTRCSYDMKRRWVRFPYGVNAWSSCVWNPPSCYSWNTPITYRRWQES